MSSSRKRSLEEEVKHRSTAQEKKQKVTQRQRVHYGLYNQGATCYLNSVLQVLSMTPEIHDRLLPDSLNTDKELMYLFKKLERTTCGTENIEQSLEIKNVHQQQDAAECLEMILRKVSKQASEVFQGWLADTTKCSEGHIVNEETNPFWTLPLSMKDKHDTTYSVEKGFEETFQTKSLKGDNLVYCNDCNKKAKATSGCEMVEFPQILTLLLKRFYFDFNTMSDVKSDCCVDVPLVLQTKNQTYKLYGMVNHVGSLRGGHYTATILSNEDETWYEFDDSHVRKVEDQPFANTRTYKSRAAYLLVYRDSGSLRDKVKEHPLEEKKMREESKENRQKSNTNREKVLSVKEEFRLTLPTDENSPQPCKCWTKIKKHPLLIVLIICVCVLVVILPIILTTV